MIRVLVAEDSPTVRELLVDVLLSDPEIKIVGTAENGLDAIAQTKALRPDIVTMDVRMPLLDGLEATALIMVEAPTPIVIISSTIDPKDVTTAMHALRAGALTALPKPPAPGSPGFEEAARSLVETVKAMAQVKVVRRWPEPAPRRPPDLLRKGRSGPVVMPLSLPVGSAPPLNNVVAIAASTGGPAALHRIVSDLPATFPAPILIVQHISPSFIQGVADWLDNASELRVKVAEDGEPIVPGTAYLAPDDAHLGVRRPGHVVLSRHGPIGGFRPSGDFLFESVANTFGASTIAVVLTGMGRDGSDGLRTVRDKKGRIVSQDEATSVVFGMPAAAIASGAVDNIAPLSNIAPVLVHLVSR
jgi:two-component system chemotaxis response regulator CheB